MRCSAGTWRWQPEPRHVVEDSDTAEDNGSPLLRQQHGIDDVNHAVTGRDVRCGWFMGTASENIMRAFDAGWGGVVTKTIGLHPVTNVAGPKTKFLRSTLDGKLSMQKRPDTVLHSSWNWELISDKPLDWWVPKIEGIKKAHPDRMLSSTPPSLWRRLSRRAHAHPDYCGRAWASPPLVLARSRLTAWLTAAAR